MYQNVIGEASGVGAEMFVKLSIQKLAGAELSTGRYPIPGTPSIPSGIGPGASGSRISAALPAWASVYYFPGAGKRHFQKSRYFFATLKVRTFLSNFQS